jgi:hypothetical protein
LHQPNGKKAKTGCAAILNNYYPRRNLGCPADGFDEFMGNHIEALPRFLEKHPISVEDTGLRRCRGMIG